MSTPQSELDALERLERLRDGGTLTPEEFNAEKRKIIRPESAPGNSNIGDIGSTRSLNFRKILFWSIAIILAFFIYSHYESASPGETSSASNVLNDPEFQKRHTYAAETIALDYEANEITADSKYSNRNFWVNGIIEDIGRELLGHPYVILNTGSSLRRVQCVLTDDQQAAFISKGSYVTIHGTCKGVNLLNVLIDEGTIAPNLNLSE